MYHPLHPLTPQADFTTGEEAAAKKASRSFKKYQYRGVELDQLLDMDNDKFVEVGDTSFEGCDYAGILADAVFLRSSSSNAFTFTLLCFALYITTRLLLSRYRFFHTARPRPCPKEVPARTQATTHGPHQEAPCIQEGRWTQREASNGQDPLA